MVRIHHFTNYKKFFNSWVQQQPKNGHGEYRRLALSLGISTTMVSQIFNGPKELSSELACEMADYLHLTDEESDYFLLMVEYSKAGSAKLRSRLQKQIQQKQEKAKRLENRLKNEHTLDITSKQQYYSSWIYPAIRILVDIPEINSVENLAQRLQINRNQAMKMFDFLIEHKIVVKRGEKLGMGPTHIYLPPADPLATRNLQNWRHLAFQKMNFQSEETFFYSGQYALSHEVANKLRQALPDFIEEILKEVKPSPSETTRCLNIDFFEF